mmetsp:Transcript_14930/g.43110  ORF Transcript_14930/g.43110 Transcript_14930/m.43110 type:complete len:116 (+) Transcript_14930:692-1039(+)
MTSEESYKYKAEDGVCHEIDRRDIRGVHNISTGDEDGIVKAVAKHGPVAVAFDVSPDFRLYSHGVYDSFNATTNQTMWSFWQRWMRRRMAQYCHGVCSLRRRHCNRGFPQMYHQG